MTIVEIYANAEDAEHLGEIVNQIKAALTDQVAETLQTERVDVHICSNLVASSEGAAEVLVKVGSRLDTRRRALLPLYGAAVVEAWMCLRRDDSFTDEIRFALNQQVTIIYTLAEGDAMILDAVEEE